MNDKNSVINQTIETLKNGGLVVFPSDTVYGLLVDATNEKAVEKLIAFKNRPPGKAISVFITEEMLYEQVEVTDKSKSLLAHLLPGPFTVILPSKHKISKKLESEKGTLGVRIPEYKLVNELVKALGKPITATSANLGGKSPHYSIESLLNQLPQKKQELIDLMVDLGKLPHNKPSTVIDLTKANIQILRQGDILLSDAETFHSKTPIQTRKLGSYLIEKISKSQHGKPIVVILIGDLGAGKTMFTKGIAEYLKVENIISPTFVVYYEYDIPNSQKSEVKRLTSKLVHVDLYNLEDTEEFDYLGLEEYLKPGNIMVVEWGEKLGNLYEKFKEKAEVVIVKIEYDGESERVIKINSSS
jgi:L-threonylcarbamoyladenylate synthase